MNKEELVRAIAAALKLDLSGRRRGGAGKVDLKKQIRQLRSAISEATQAKNSNEAQRLRRAVKRLKRQTRHLAAASRATAVPTTAPTESAA